MIVFGVKFCRSF